MIKTIITTLLILASQFFNYWYTNQKTQQEHTYTQYKNKKTKARLRKEFEAVVSMLAKDRDFTPLTPSQQKILIEEING